MPHEKISALVEKWIEDNFTFVDDVAKKQLITLLATESDGLREALRQYAIHENWACWKTQQKNVWERDYEHGYKLAEEALGEGRIWPRDRKEGNE